MVWIGKNLKDVLVPTPLPWQLAFCGDVGVLAPSQYCQTQLWPSNLTGPGKQTGNAQEEIAVLQHYRCQSKVSAVHVTKAAAPTPK